MNRAAISSDSLVKLILILVVVWLGLEVLGELIGMVLGPFSALRPIVGLVVLVLLVWFVLDRL